MNIFSLKDGVDKCRQKKSETFFFTKDRTTKRENQPSKDLIKKSKKGLLSWLKRYPTQIQFPSFPAIWPSAAISSPCPTPPWSPLPWTPSPRAWRRSELKSSRSRTSLPTSATSPWSATGASGRGSSSGSRGWPSWSWAPSGWRATSSLVLYWRVWLLTLTSTSSWLGKLYRQRLIL